MNHDLQFMQSLYQGQMSPVLEDIYRKYNSLSIGKFHSE